MRRADVRPTACAFGLAILGGSASTLPGCRPPPPRDPTFVVAACPRDARPDASGRCACDPGDLPVLGACVPPPVADAYCGPAARATESGACVFRPCAGTEVADVDTGCIPGGSLLHGGPHACEAGEALAVEDRRSVCIAADAACPRGTRAEGASCTPAPRCPPGALASGAACRPIVLRGDDGARQVDLAAWATLVLGSDGGPGSADLCRPFQAHPAALELTPADRLALHVHVILSAPDGDVTQVSAEVRTSTGARGAAAHALPPAAAALAESAVATLVEPLRGLGGEATATRVEVEVRCDVGTRRPPPLPPAGSSAPRKTEAPEGGAGVE